MPLVSGFFKIVNALVEFKASFSGVIHIISVPVQGILAVYAEENGEGLFLDAEEELIGGEETTGAGTKNKRSHLRSIDGTSAESIDGFSMDAPPIVTAAKAKPVLKLVE